MRHDPVLNRRQFVSGSAICLAGAFARRASGQRQRTGTIPSTGLGHQALAIYDRFMMEFMEKYQPPGAALAITHDGKLMYAKGFGYADVDSKEPVQPTSLFRIASISKPITSAAVFRLIEQGRVKLDQPIFPLIQVEPYLPMGNQFDKRIETVTIRHCLQHTAGWDRAKGFDPMAARDIERAAVALGVRLPLGLDDIIRHALGKPLDFDPGTAHAYSNFGYCLLGRMIERVTGTSYEAFTREEVLQPLGITGMRVAKSLLSERAPGEVRYHATLEETGRAISGPDIGQQVPRAYGVEAVELLAAAGGWLASAVELMKFAVAFDDPKRCPILSEESLRTMLERPPGPAGMNNGQPKQVYYACGWWVRQPAPGQDRPTKWHGGGLVGSQTLMVCREDGTNWAVLFNGDQASDGGKFAAIIDNPLHRPADAIRSWPGRDLFDRVQ